MKLPELLAIGIHCFESNGSPGKIFTDYPDKLYLEEKGVQKEYEKYAQSCQMYKFRWCDKTNRSRAFAGHTWLYIKTRLGWAEVNNNLVYEINELPKEQYGACLLYYRSTLSTMPFPRASSLLPPRGDSYNLIG